MDTQAIQQAYQRGFSERLCAHVRSGGPAKQAGWYDSAMSHVVPFLKDWAGPVGRTMERHPFRTKMVLAGMGGLAAQKGLDTGIDWYKQHRMANLGLMDRLRLAGGLAVDPQAVSDRLF